MSSLILQSLLALCALFVICSAFGRVQFQDHAQTLRFHDPNNENEYLRMLSEYMSSPQRRSFRPII